MSEKLNLLARGGHYRQYIITQGLGPAKNSKLDVPKATKLGLDFEYYIRLSRD